MRNKGWDIYKRIQSNCYWKTNKRGYGLVKNNPKANGEATHPNDWKKMRGSAIILNKETGNERQAEVHWYECPNIGKIKFKTIPGLEVNRSDN